MHTDVGVAWFTLEPVAQGGVATGNENIVPDAVTQGGVGYARPQPSLLQDVFAPEQLDPVCQMRVKVGLELRFAACAHVGVGHARFAAQGQQQGFAQSGMVVEIEDNGVGMDRETRDKAFSLFFSSKGLKGTGLGLFISNKIVDKHGGEITVDSEPGRGTRFVVRLPLEPRPSVQPREA